MNNKEQENEKQKKAGNPIFIIIIFVALLGFVFYVPEVYKKYNSNIAEFLGIGSKPDAETKPEEEIPANSAFYQIGSNGTLDYNELRLSNISLTNGVLTMDITSEEEINLDELNYYIEFYEQRETFKGRRGLTGTLKGTKTVALDVSELNVTTVTYFMVSHIADSAIGPIELNTDESGLGEFTCTRKDYSYNYTFGLDKLIKVTEKYSYENADLSAYSSVLLEYQKTANEYNEFNGITSSVVDNSNAFVFIAEYDYSSIPSYPKVNEKYIFSKDVMANVIKFKMEAEGFECK